MSPAVPLAVYDFDGTVIKGDSIVAYLRFAHARGYITPAALLGAAMNGLYSRLHLLSAGEAKYRALRFRERMTTEARNELDLAFAEELFTRVRPGALAQIARDRTAERLIILLSASTDNYMHPLADRLGVDKLICTRLDELPDGNCRGAAKVRRLQMWLSENGITPDFPASAAYGDSLSDEPVLALVGHPAVVNPTARVQKRFQNRFPVLRWPDRQDKA